MCNVLKLFLCMQRTRRVAFLINGHNGLILIDVFYFERVNKKEKTNKKTKEE